MLSEEILSKLQHIDYWKRSYEEWKVDTWDFFYFKKYPNETKRKSHSALAIELEVLIKYLRPKTRKGRKVLDLKRKLKSGKKDGERENITHTSFPPTSAKKSNIDEKDNPKKRLKPDHEASTEVSLTKIIHNILPDLVYLQLRHYKSDSSTISVEQRFPDRISNWVGFKEEVRSWQSEYINKRYKKPVFGSHGRALEDMAGEPDFIVVDENCKALIPFEYKTIWVLKVPSNKNIVSLYLREKKTRKGKYAGSKDTTVYEPINQIYGYMCANKLCYGVLSTFNQTWFLKRGVKEDQGWLQISDVITNTSTDPTLLKSVAYVIFTATSNRYSPFIEKPAMFAVKELSSDTSDEEQKDDKDLKYKGKNNTSSKGLNVITRSQSRQALGSLGNILAS
ncbi:14744_t:CDS:2 [Entrophospora sp. SA101]|nr:14744_t:CDS:2 [Entrophospora sp. SA101]CAJ0842109.1 12642_t:CDS:2 [Entrophospora sp. SA101]